MSTLKTNKAQLGQSGTATQNFTITAEAADGTMKLARGNAGATTQDILTVDAAGVVSFPQNPTGKFTSAEIAIPAGNTLASANHGLGTIPLFYSVVLRCKVAELGYAVGDEVDITSEIDGDGGRSGGTAVNATSVSYYSNAANPFVKSRLAAGGTYVTPANWKLVFRAMV